MAGARGWASSSRRPTRSTRPSGGSWRPRASRSIRRACRSTPKPTATPDRPPSTTTSVARVPAVATAAALVGALRALGVRRISLATPYHDPLTDHERDFFARCRIDTVTARGLGFGATGPDDYRNIARLPTAVAYRLAKSVDRPEADAIVISCTDFATLGVIPVLESELGKPVISSNQATFWAALRAAGVGDRPGSFGRLLREH